MVIKEHNKEDYEVRCPNCGEEDISEVTGWCYNHHNPTFEGDRRFCRKTDECGFIAPVKDAYFCNDCDTLYDKKNMTNWNWSEDWYGNCPVGEELPEVEEEQTPEEYSESLLDLMSEYNEVDLNKCISNNRIIEAIIILHRHLAEQIRFLLINKIREAEDIKPSKVDKRYEKIVDILKEMDDVDCFGFAFIYDIINNEQKGDISALNTLRNIFVHAFNIKKRQKYSDNEILIIIEKAKNVSNILDRTILPKEG